MLVTTCIFTLGTVSATPRQSILEKLFVSVHIKMNELYRSKLHVCLSTLLQILPFAKMFDRFACSLSLNNVSLIRSYW